MKRMLLLALALSLTMTLGGVALAQDDTVAPRGEKAFKAMDTNADGKISKEEYVEAAKKRAEARFDKLDATGKGFLTKEEFLAGKAKRTPKKAAKDSQ